MQNARFPNTTFPHSFQNIEKYQDISREDVNLLKSFQSHIQNARWGDASLVLSQIPNAKNKLITAHKLNLISDTIQALEEFFITEIYPFLSEKEKDWKLYIDRFRYIDVYNADSKYEQNNIVLDDWTGRAMLFLCVLTPPTTGLRTTDTRYWRQLTIEGARGEAGVGAKFEFEWKENVSYAKDSIVIYANSWWISNEENINVVPSENTTIWTKVMTGSQVKYPIQAEEPVGQKVGDLWFRLV